MATDSSLSLRVSTLDRTARAQELLAHHHAGRLDRPEFDKRLVLVDRARTEDDLARLVIDLPDLPGPSSYAPVSPIRTGGRSALGETFDVMVMLITMAAFICTALLYIAALSSMREDGAFVALLGGFGSFSFAAGSVHLIHRLRERQRG
jgi:hypothetical protein